MILPPPVCDNPAVLEILEQHQIPVVLIAPSSSNPSTTAIKIDDRAAAYAMTKHVIDKGHIDIAFIKGDPEHGGAGERFGGFLSAMKAHDIATKAEFIEQGYFSFDSGFSCAERLFELKNTPSVIFACNDEMASAVISCAAQKNIRVPEDVSVVGFDDAVIASRIWPTLTTVRQPAEEIAVVAVEYLKSVQQASEDKATEAKPVIVLEHTFIERSSCIRFRKK